MANEPLSDSGEHEHEWRFVRTDADWWDGDETDVYECDCGERRSEYIPR